MRITVFAIALATVLTFTAPVSQAAPISFDLTYSGAQFGNAASATGSITFDDTLLPNPGVLLNVAAGALGISSFSITVSGASVGNGTFGLADVTNWIWDVSLPLNLAQELVGQAGFNDFNWCAFDFDGCVPPAPGGISPFTIATNAETGDTLGLVSMRPAVVPEPASVALLGVGLAGLGVVRWKVKWVGNRQ